MNKTAWFSIISWGLFLISIQYVIWRLFGIESTRIYFNQYPEIFSIICVLLLPVFVILWAINSFKDTLKELHKKRDEEDAKRSLIANYEEKIVSLQQNIKWLLPRNDSTVNQDNSNVMPDEELNNADCPALILDPPINQKEQGQQNYKPNELRKPIGGGRRYVYGAPPIDGGHGLREPIDDGVYAYGAPRIR